MKRTFFIVVLAIFFTFDIFFAISSAVAENLKGSSNVEIVNPSEGTEVIFRDTTDRNSHTEAGVSIHK
ncbi:MAG: hypothetical protein WBA39_06570 [Rivularia sp. (in: cyanobacteria)]